MTTNFFFNLNIFFWLSHPTLSLLGRERIWNIYQGIVNWRHHLYMVMFLAFEITVCSGGQNNLFVAMFFFVMFSGAQLHKHVFLLMFSECGEYGLFDGALLHQTDLKCSVWAHKCELKSWSSVERDFYSTSACVQSFFRIPPPLFNYLTIDGCLLCGPDVWLPFWLYKTCYRQRWAQCVCECVCVHANRCAWVCFDSLTALSRLEIGQDKSV